MRQRLAVLGSTGSIGTQALDIVRCAPDRFEVATLTSNRNWELLVRQAREFMPDSVVIADKGYYPPLKEALADLPVKVYAGEESVEQVVRGTEVDTVLNALVGYAGLGPTVSALGAGKKLALANKESLVVAGELVMKLSADNRAPILPVDSEHSAILQCLVGEVSPVERIVLTASGGPLRDVPPGKLSEVTVEQALAHPNWKMGAKITIDSASMMNKGFEVIEAHWLFGLPPSRIEVVVHPQSVVHSMACFADGALKAQLGTPDMRVPIQYALAFPERLPLVGNSLDICKLGSLTFMEADNEKFPLLRLAYEALDRGGNCACVLNAANEVAVAAFLERKIRFTDIARLVEHALAKADFVRRPSLEDHRLCDGMVRAMAREWVEGKL